MRVRLSGHARDQAIARAKMSPDDLCALLERGHYVEIYELRKKARLFHRKDGEFKRRGKKKRQVHKLFFSWAAGVWCVALEDVESGVVISIHYPWFDAHRTHAEPGLVEALRVSPRQITDQRGGA